MSENESRSGEKTKNLVQIFAAAAAGAAGTAIIGLVFSSATLEWINRVVQLPVFPRGTVLFVQDKDCEGLGREWTRLEAAEGKYIRAAAKGDSFIPGQAQAGGNTKFKIALDNLPKLDVTAVYGRGALDWNKVNGDNKTWFVTKLGEARPNEGGSVAETFPIAGTTGSTKEIDVTPPFIPLTACQKK